MAEGGAPQFSRALAMGKTIAKFVGAWALAYFVIFSRLASDADRWIYGKAIPKIFGGFPAIVDLAEKFYTRSMWLSAAAYGAILFFATGLAPLGAAAHMVARARLRAGQADFLDRLRAWTLAHPRWTRALLAAPSVWWLWWHERPGNWGFNHPWLWFNDLLVELPSVLVGSWAMFLMARKGLGELLAPTMGGEDAQGRFEIGPDEIVFDAVAVTRRTLAMVAVFSAVTLAVPMFIATRPILALFHERSIFYLVFAYIAFAIGGAAWFRKASHIAVGVDGVHVRGTARARFYAYRDIDSARVAGGDIELVRRGRAVLRLQLHGEDAARREAVLARITEHIARVKEGRGAAAAQLVATSSKGDLARVAQGGADYRMATLTREQLWALVEGPEVEESARRAAAEALAATRDPRERERLRIAAEHCAQPHVRVALEEIARGEGDDARGARAARVV